MVLRVIMAVFLFLCRVAALVISDLSVASGG